MFDGAIALHISQAPPNLCHDATVREKYESEGPETTEISLQAQSRF